MSRTDYKRIRGFFLRAMALAVKGEMVNALSKTEPLIPGFRSFEYREENLRLVDSYFPGALMSGMTIIWEDDKPVWMMTYGGYYPDEIVPFLLRALAKEYEEPWFNGGRGPSIFIEDNLVYLNKVQGGNEFGGTSGCEEIIDSRNKAIMGWNSYACYRLEA